MLDAAVDHTAIAVRDMRVAIPFVTELLGGSFLFAGDALSQNFRWAQFRMPGGGKIELVTPLGEGFLARFLERRGEGVHHVTLKVPDLRAAIDHLVAGGVQPFGISLENPGWQEAFIHPRDAHGTLLQLAQSSWSDEDTARHHLTDHGGQEHQHLTLDRLMSEPGSKPADPAGS